MASERHYVFAWRAHVASVPRSIPRGVPGWPAGAHTWATPSSMRAAQRAAARAPASPYIMGARACYWTGLVAAAVAYVITLGVL